VATSIQELTYELSLGALNQQESSLNELRSRTGVLLAATAIAIALLGGRVLDDGARTAIDLAGVALAIFSLLLSVFVLAPKSRYVVTIDAAAGPRVLQTLEGRCLRSNGSACVFESRGLGGEPGND
jgi:ABC-type transport system involved in cytochrome bd biosynthesis fused ATPase/permease subunit